MADYNLGIGSRIEHPKYGKGVVLEMDTEFYSIWFKDGNSTRGIARDYEGLTVLEKTTADVVPITLDDIKRAIREVVDEKSDLQEIVPLASRWNNGTLIIKSADASVQPKESFNRNFFQIGRAHV